MFWLLYASVLFVTTNGLPPPSYIKPCSVKKNFEKCALESGRQALETFVKGDKKYGIPLLEPFYLPPISIDNGAFKLNLMEIVLTGLSKGVFNGMTFDPTTKHAKIAVDTPHTKLKGKYDMNGKILVLAIEGKGDFEINFYNTSSVFTFDIEKENINGEVYPKLANDKFESKIGSAHLQFDNLFNGDKVLGPEINKVLNENWDAVNEEVESSYKQTVSKVCQLILGSYFRKIPYKTLFLD